MKIHHKSITSFFILISLVLVSLSSWALDEINHDAGLAIGGYDPVAYFTEQQAVWGNSKYSHQWKGVTWQFDSNSNKELFISNPSKYAPQYGGYCAYAAAKGSVAPGDPNAWTVVDGKLYLNYSPAVKQRWTSNMFGFISRADGKWPKMIKQR